jgi:hypothetical protein
MKFIVLALGVAFCAPFCIGQSLPTADNSGAGVAVQAPDVVPDPDELIAYRFRLAAPDGDYSLVASNRTDKPAKFFLRGLTPELEKLVQNVPRTQVDPGQTLTMPAAELRWPDFQAVYVEASRRVELRLVRTGSPENLVIPLTPRNTLYDVVDEQRLGETLSGDFDQTISLLGSSDVAMIVLRAYDDPRVASMRLVEKVPPGRARIFLIVPLRPKPPGGSGN